MLLIYKANTSYKLDFPVPKSAMTPIVIIIQKKFLLKYFTINKVCQGVWIIVKGRRIPPTTF